MKRPHTQPRAAGFTLIELMVSLAIAMIVVAGVFNLYNTFFKSTTVQDQVLNLQQNSRVALDDLERDLRLAGVDITRDNGVLPDQAVFAFAAPYDVVFNANLKDATAGMRTDKAPDKVPESLAGGVSPDYDPSVSYPYAETVRWSLDDNRDGVIDATDRMSTENPALYRLVREVYGYNASTDSNGPDVAVASDDLRGPDAYPDGTRPPILFQYWVQELDLNDNKTVDAGEDINGNGKIDLFLWGDDGGAAGTSSPQAGNGVLDDSEIASLLTGNGGGPKVIDNFNALITSTTGDARATALTRAQVLSHIKRVVVNVVTETPNGDAAYRSSPHGVTYPYREHVVTASVAPRNKLTDVTSDMSLTITASPANVTCPDTSTVLTVALRESSGALSTAAADVDLTTSLGSFSAVSSQPTSTVTLSGGTASVVLYGDTTTTASFAVVNGVTTVGAETYNAATTIEFLPGPASVINVKPDVNALPADGLSTTEVTSTVLDACGKPTGNGDAFTWGLSTSPVGIGGGLSPATGTVAGNRLTTTLTSGLSAGIATITGTDTVTSAWGTGTVNYTNCVVTLTPAETALPADGVSSTVLSFHLADVGGTPQAGVSIDVTTSDGIVTPTTVITDSAGNATGALVSSTNPHTAKLTATVPPTGGYCDYAVGTAEVDFSECGVTVTSDVSEVVPGTPGGSANITANVADSLSGSPLVGQGVTFALTSPDGTLSPLTGTSDSSGNVTSTFTAGPTTGVATISAITGCGTDTVDVYVRDCVVVVEASPTTIPTTAGSTTSITATLSDRTSGTPLAGRTVTFNVDNPSLAVFPAGNTATTDVSGQAVVTIESLGTAGTVNVTATSECGSDSVAVVIADWQIGLTSVDSTVSAGASTTLTATITTGGTPMDPPSPDNVVNFSFDAPGGLGSTLTPGSGVTSGGAKTSTFAAGSTAGTVTVRASATIGGVLISTTLDIVITSSGGVDALTLEVGSPDICGSSHDRTSFTVRNSGIDDLRIDSVQITWTGGGQLEQIRTGGSASGCSGGTDLWVGSGCGRPNSNQFSPANITSFCKSAVVSSGSTYSFNRLNYRWVDMRGQSVTAIITHHPVGGGATATSTISFTVPNF